MHIVCNISYLRAKAEERTDSKNHEGRIIDHVFEGLKLIKHAGCYIDFFQICLEIYFTDFLMNYNVGMS